MFNAKWKAQKRTVTFMSNGGYFEPVDKYVVTFNSNGGFNDEKYNITFNSNNGKFI